MAGTAPTKMLIHKSVQQQSLVPDDSLPDSTATVNHRDQDRRRRICAFSPTCQAHPKPSSAHGVQSLKGTITHSPPLACSSRSISCIELCYQAQNALSSVSIPTTNISGLFFFFFFLNQIVSINSRENLHLLDSLSSA